jgi:chorismate mutase
MSHSSRESNLAQFRELLLQVNTQILQLIVDRRNACLRIQELKGESGRFSHYDPDRELVVFNHLQDDLKTLSIKELLAFSLVMEDQAMAMAPGSYPTWSLGSHLTEPAKDFFGMINPLLLKTTHPNLFNRLSLNSEFAFLKDF